MRIGIDISQLAYPGTGVATFLQSLIEHVTTIDGKNEYILFYSSLRRKLQPSALRSLSKPKNVIIKSFYFPPTVLDMIWNVMHIIPIEKFIGPVDVFISSDWTQPPTKAKKVTILYDLIVFKYPEETAEKIVKVQKRRLEWVKKEVNEVLCISEATKNDAAEILAIPKEKLSVVYPGI